MTDEDDTQPTRPSRRRRAVTNDDVPLGGNTEGLASAHCCEIGVTGACGAPADLRCPTCGHALCFTCAREHVKSDAPLCGRRGGADTG